MMIQIAKSSCLLMANERIYLSKTANDCLYILYFVQYIHNDSLFCYDHYFVYFAAATSQTKCFCDNSEARSPFVLSEDFSSYCTWFILLLE